MTGILWREFERGESWSGRSGCFSSRFFFVEVPLDERIWPWIGAKSSGGNSQVSSGDKGEQQCF